LSGGAGLDVHVAYPDARVTVAAEHSMISLDREWRP
jgi:hypothetical protein